MTQIRLDVLKDLADQLVGVRKEIEDIARAAASAETAIGRMGQRNIVNAPPRPSGGLQVIQGGSGSAPTGIFDEAGRMIVNRADDPRYNVYTAPNSVANDPSLQGWQTASERTRAMISGTATPGLQDLARVRQGQLQYASPEGQQRIGQIASRLESGSSTDAMIGQAVRDLSSEFRKQAQVVSKITDELKNFSGSDKELAEKKAELAKAVQAAAESQEKLADASKAAESILTGGGGGGGTGGGKSFVESFGEVTRVIAKFTAGLQAVGGATLGFMGAQQAGYRQDVTSNFQAVQAAGGIESIAFQRQMGAMNLTSGANVMRYFGNYAAPDLQFSYLGTAGRRRADAAARQMSENELDIARRDQTLTLGQFGLSALGRIGGGIAAGAGTGALTGALGGPIGAVGGAILGGLAGVGSVLGSVGGLASEYAANQATRAQGGLANTMFGGLLYGNQSGQMADNARTQFFNEQMLRQDQRRQALQDAEMQRADVQKRIMGYDEYRRGISTRQSFASLIGGMSSSGFEDIVAGAGNIPIERAGTLPGRILRGDNMASMGTGELATRLRRRFLGNQGQVQEAIAAEEARVQPFINMSADRQLSIPEFAAIRNQLSGILSNRASNAQAGRLVDLSRAGIGSQEQLMGNLMGLQQVSGPQQGLKQLETVMASAVAAGFDRAQFAQRFVASVTELSSSLKVSDTARTSATLAATSEALTGQRGSLLGLSMAQAGMQQVGAFTGQTQGLTGTLKAMALFGAGGTVGTGANLIQGMNAFQLSQGQDIIGKALKSGNMNALGGDPRITQAIRAARGGTGFESMSPQEQRAAMERVQRQFGATAQAAWAPVQGVVDAMGGQGKYQSLLQSAQSALKSGDKNALQNVLSEVAALGPVEGMDTMGVTSGFLRQAMGDDTAMSAAQRQGALNQAVDTGTKNYRDEFSVKRQRFVSTMAATAARDMNRRVTDKQLREYFDVAGGGAAAGEALQVNVGGKVVSLRSMEDFNKLGTDDRNSALAQITTGRLMSGQMAKIAEAEGTQTRIDSFGTTAINDLTLAIRNAMSKDYRPTEYEAPTLSRGVK